LFFFAAKANRVEMGVSAFRGGRCRHLLPSAHLLTYRYSEVYIRVADGADVLQTLFYFFVLLYRKTKKENFLDSLN